VAEEWQLCWECPPEAPYLRASFVLNHTFVNLLPGTHGYSVPNPDLMRPEMLWPVLPSLLQTTVTA